MQHLAKRIAELNESQTIRMAQLSREMKQKGIDIIDLSLGEPDFGTPQNIRDAAKRAIDSGFSHYPPVPGYLDLREAISQKFKEHNNLHFTPDQIVVSTGAKQSLANVILSMVNPGEEVIVPTPYWVSYAAQIQLASGNMVNIPTGIENEFKITPEQLEDAITEKTKLFIFSSPCNPTGSVYSHGELRALADVFAKHEDVYILSDEIYEVINFKDRHVSIAEFEEIQDRVIIINGLSKGYAMTGWRIGYMAAPAWIAQACTKMQGQFTSATNSIAQRAAIEALLGDQSVAEHMKTAFQNRRELMMDLLKDTRGFKLNNPEGAFYLFPDVSELFGKSYKGQTIEDADDLAMLILEEVHVSVVTGKAFGDPRGIRLSYANSEENLRKAAERINDLVAKIN